MRLYTRGQIIVAVFATAVMAGALGLWVAGFAGRRTDSQTTDTHTAEVPASPSAANTASTADTAPDSFATAETLPVADTGKTAGSSPYSSYTVDENENINVYERYNESVVNITTEVVSVNWFLEPVPQSGGSGSGSIIDERGYVLTNNHVVSDAYKLYVNLADGSRYEAKLVGADAENDLAVIKFTPPAGLKLRPIPFGTSKGLKVGQKVLAIGNPFGLERTLTIGIVSGLGRPIQKDEKTILQNMIQTDASINPGNSGGPLLNARGEMIGINTMIYSTSGGSVGIGFAVPVDTAVRIVPDLIKDGKVRRGWIEMEALQLFPDLIDYMNQNGYAAPVEKGLLVSTVSRGANAEKAGLRGGAKAVRYGNTVFNVGGDIVTNIDGRNIGTIADLYSALEDNKPGEKVWVEYWRDGKKAKAQIVLSERASR
ncbi:MAG: trypsin-like peptidase domain-containing protein [Rectinema sp.]